MNIKAPLINESQSYWKNNAPVVQSDPIFKKQHHSSVCLIVTVKERGHSCKLVTTCASWGSPKRAEEGQWEGLMDETDWLAGWPRGRYPKCAQMPSLSCWLPVARWPMCGLMKRAHPRQICRLMISPPCASLINNLPCFSEDSKCHCCNNDGHHVFV